jgi:hypothetical protein
MFRSFSWEHNQFRYVNGGKRYIICIIDTDFTETITADHYWEAMVLVYRKRNLNIASNLALAIRHEQRSSENDIVKLASKCTNGIYDEEIQKYLMLI